MAGFFCLSSLLLLLYVYGGYLAVLALIALFAAPTGAIGRGAREAAAPGEAQDGAPPGATVYFSALDEEENVEERIEDILRQDYPRDRLEIIVISDGSTDGTVERAGRAAERRPEADIKVVAFETNEGKYRAQNWASANSRFDILVATDAETRFAPGFLAEIVRPFRDPETAAAGGATRFADASSSIAAFIGRYRRMENAIRRLETRLGVMTKTDGYCTAYRKSVWETLEPFEDLDQSLVLIARRKGLRAVHVEKAVCLEVPNSTAAQELTQRSRMTRQALFSIFHRWGLRDALAHPLFTCAFFSHKVLRFFSPLYLVVFALSAAVLIVKEGAAGPVLAGLLAVAELYPLNRWLLKSAALYGLFGMFYSFLLSNLAFALGLWGWLRGDAAGRWKPTRTLK